MTIQRRAVLAATLVAAAIAHPSAFAQKKIVLGFAQVGAESAWRTANTESIKSAAKDVIAGKTLPKRILTNETVYTQAQAAAALPSRKY